MRHKIGLLYYEGNEDFEKNKVKAKRWLTASAKKGNGAARYQLGLIHEEVEITTKR